VKVGESDKDASLLHNGMSYWYF